MLSIRDPRAARLAKELATKRKTTMTQAIVEALEHELDRERDATPLAERLRKIAQKAAVIAGPNGRAMSKDDIDALWGQ
jgi:antitoxin VapB